MLRTAPKVKSVKTNQRLRVAVIVGEFNPEVTSGLQRGALQALGESGVPTSKIKTYHVAGSFEVAQLAMGLAKSKRFDALVCLGAIVRGETTHDQHLADAVTSGLLRVSLDTGVPVGLGIITTKNISQALARSRPDRRNRGYGAAAAVVGLVSVTP
jgi:6,7-dimethyl-8-ribityllumazine synthase